MIALSEAGSHPDSASARDLAKATDAARLAGFAVHSFPADFSRCGDAEGALCHVPSAPTPTPAVWIGYVPSLERYQAIFEAARHKNLFLVNSPDEHRNSQEMDSALPRLGELTPSTAFVASAEEAQLAAEAVGGFPVFVKGAVQSRKSRGWRACIAESEPELRAQIDALLALEERSRGRVAVRRLLRLRHAQTRPNGFPQGREFRAFLCRGVPLGVGWYWDAADTLADLTDTERATVRGLAEEAARRVETPYLSVDIGEDEAGRWWVLETGDGQFSGAAGLGSLTLWSRLREALQGSGALA